MTEPESNWLSFAIGGAECERVEVRVEPGNGAPRGPYDGPGARVRIAAGAFVGDYDCWIEAIAFTRLLADLRALRAQTVRRVELRLLERQLELTIDADAQGHLDVRGACRDRPGTGNRLDWSFEIDQSYLPTTIERLARVVAAHPITTEADATIRVPSAQTAEHAPGPLASSPAPMGRRTLAYVAPALVFFASWRWTTGWPSVAAAVACGLCIVAMIVAGIAATRGAWGTPEEDLEEHERRGGGR